MTAREFIAWVATLPWWVALAAFLAPPLIAKLLGYVHGRDEGRASPWKYFYALLVYWACVPGILALVVSGYALFFANENLLDLPLLVYVLPPISMAVTLVWIKQNVAFDDVPGFDRLSGLMIVIAVSFVLVLAVHKTRLWLVFGGSIFLLAALAIGLIALLQWGLSTLLGRSGGADRDSSQV